MNTYHSIATPSVRIRMQTSFRSSNGTFYFSDSSMLDQVVFGHRNIPEDTVVIKKLKTGEAKLGYQITVDQDINPRELLDIVVALRAEILETVDGYTDDIEIVCGRDEMTNLPCVRVMITDIEPGYPYPSKTDLIPSHSRRLTHQTHVNAELAAAPEAPVTTEKLQAFLDRIGQEILVPLATRLSEYLNAPAAEPEGLKQ